MNVFDFVNAINSSKKPNLLRGTDNDELAEKAYVPFVVNRSFSYFLDTILYANAMNMSHQLDNTLQNDYLLNSIRPARRFSKWAKPDGGDLQLIMEYFHYGIDKAKQVRPLLTESQLSIIRDVLMSGIKDDNNKQVNRGEVTK